MDIRSKIINGASQLFVKYGIRSITMDMIAEQLGTSKRTIYENFTDKDELLNSCLEAAIKKQKKLSEEIIQSSENIVDATFKFIKHIINIYQLINPLFFFDIQKYYPELYNSRVKGNEKWNVDRSVELLNTGIQEGLFRKDINIEIVAILITEQFKMLNNAEIFPIDKFSKIEVFENIVINFMRGISSDKGLILIDQYNI